MGNGTSIGQVQKRSVLCRVAGEKSVVKRVGHIADSLLRFRIVVVLELAPLNGTGKGS